MPTLEESILNTTGASGIQRIVSIQALWSGYGELKKYYLSGGKYASVIVKHIQWPEKKHHPRGWNSEFSHQRKLKSYQVEMNWYAHFAHRTHALCKVPEVYQVISGERETVLIMEDLDACGFPVRLTPDKVLLPHVKSCLTWLAHFHAIFMGVEAANLWDPGTYWHLDTRPEELEKMKHQALKAVAGDIDYRLNSAKYQTIVHGDAKLANFCFSQADKVAAVDFQYVGKGCGMKDVAYLISSCFDDAACEAHETTLLRHYFETLRGALKNSDINYTEIEKEWRTMYIFAWADFYRFLDGWNPGHWKMHPYSERMAQEAINELANNSIS